MSRDIRTKALVLRRTNYGEADRILNLITPEGQFSVLAKAVRKEKSRLAGGIELFCLSEVTLHQGRGELKTLTSSKMLEFYQELLTDLHRLELATSFLKQINRLSSHYSTPEHFHLLKYSLSALNSGIDSSLVEAWFLLQLLRINGEQPNFSFDDSGSKLLPERRYRWDFQQSAFSLDQSGTFKQSHIKLLRLLSSAPLDLILKVQNKDSILSDLSPLIRILASH